MPFQPYDSDSDSDYDMEIHDLTAYTDDDFINYTSNPTMSFEGLDQIVQPSDNGITAGPAADQTDQNEEVDDANNADSGASDEMDVDNRSDDDASQNSTNSSSTVDSSMVSTLLSPSSHLVMF